MNSFDTQFLNNYRGLTKFAVLLTRHRQDANDLLQDTYEIGRRNHEKFDGRNFYAWTCTIMRNHWFTLRRRSRFVQHLDDVEVEQLSGSIPCNAAACIDLQAVTKKISTLPECFRDTLVLIAFEDLSQEETAERLGIPVNTVKSRTNRARTQLREMLSA